MTKPSDITPTSVALTQQFGAVVYALTAPLVLAILNARRGIESRQSIYYTLGSGEAFMISLSLYQAYALNGGGFSPKSLLGLSANLAPLLLWHLYVLGPVRLRRHMRYEGLILELIWSPDMIWRLLFGRYGDFSIWSSSISAAASNSQAIPYIVVEMELLASYQ